MLSLAHDFRVMRVDRGFWCLPEAEINIPFTPGMSTLLQARLAPQVAHEAMTTARRYGGADALTAAIVDLAVGAEEVRGSAVQIAGAQAGKAGVPWPQSRPACTRTCATPITCSAELLQRTAVGCVDCHERAGQ